MTDPFVGQLTFIRVYSGTLNSGSYVYNSTKGVRERVGRLLKMHANKREEIEQIYSGDICAAVGLKATLTGHTLCDESKPVILEAMTFPEPVISVAIEPKTKADQEKLGLSLQKLMQKIPRSEYSRIQRQARPLFPGMGELHLEIIVDRLLREFKVDANVGKPQVAYRETIKKKVTAEGKFIRQSGGRGQYGHVVLEMEPQEPGKGFESLTDGRRFGSEGICCLRLRRGLWKPWRTALLAAIPWSILKSPLLTVPITMWIPRKWRSRSRDPWGSRKAQLRLIRPCSSRSWRSRSSVLRSTWVTSSVTSAPAAGRVQGMT